MGWAFLRVFPERLSFGDTLTASWLELCHTPWPAALGDRFDDYNAGAIHTGEQGNYGWRVWPDSDPEETLARGIDKAMGVLFGRGYPRIYHVARWLVRRDWENAREDSDLYLRWNVNRLPQVNSLLSATDQRCPQDYRCIQGVDTQKDAHTWCEYVPPENKPTAKRSFWRKPPPPPPGPRAGSKVYPVDQPGNYQKYTQPGSMT